MIRKIAAVTGTRAEYGILSPVLREIQARPSLELQLLVTGMHLSPEFGLTFQQIEEDGFPISEKLEIILSADTETAISTSIGLGIISFSKSYEHLKPDILLLLGDRFESLAAATAAMVARIPIGHIAGGHTGQGAIDEAIRHSITKMSHLHFTSMLAYRDRIIQMGEQPDRVFVTGTPSVDGIKQVELLDKEDLEVALGLDLSRPAFLVVYHPVTLEKGSAGHQIDQLLAALSHFGSKFIFIMPNADTEGRTIAHQIDTFVKRNPASKVFVNLKRHLYLNLLRFVSVMVGNSSGGIIEAPSFELPVVNVGERQRSRIQARNVIDCGNDAESIVQAINQAIGPTFKESLRGLANPHGDGDSSKRIVDVLEGVELGQDLLKKKFFDIRLSGASL